MQRTLVVRFLRAAFPLVALILLSTMFLFSDKTQEESQIPYANVDLESAVRGSQIVAPRYATVASDGTQLMLRASDITPDGAGGTGVDIRLDWRDRGGIVGVITAPIGRMQDGYVMLEGGVRVQTSAGWIVTAPTLDAALDRPWITGKNGVEAEISLGMVRADHLRFFTEATGQDRQDDKVLELSGNVRAIYQP